MQRQFLEALSTPFYDSADLDVLAGCLFEFIQSEHPGARLDVDRSDVREFLKKVP